MHPRHCYVIWAQSVHVRPRMNFKCALSSSINPSSDKNEIRINEPWKVLIEQLLTNWPLISGLMHVSDVAHALHFAWLCYSVVWNNSNSFQWWIPHAWLEYPLVFLKNRNFNLQYVRSFHTMLILEFLFFVVENFHFRNQIPRTFYYEKRKNLEKLYIFNFENMVDVLRKHNFFF